MKRIMLDRCFMLDLVVEFLLNSDKEDEALMSIDFNKEDNMRKLIRDYVVPKFFEFKKIKQQVIKDNFEYFLVTKDVEVFTRTLDQIPVDIPDPFKFYSLIWDELFHEPLPESLNPDYHYEYNDTQDFINLVDLTGYREEIEDNQEQSK